MAVRWLKGTSLRMMMGCLAGFSQQGFEVGRAGGQDHLVGLAGLSVAGEGHVGEGLLVAKVLERRDHVGLEVVPAEAKLLLVTGHLGVCACFSGVWNLEKSRSTSSLS